MKAKLRIGIDGRSLQGHRAGIGRYIFELCKELDQILPSAQFFVYSQYPVDMPVLSERWVPRMDPVLIKKYMKSVIWLKLRCGSLCRADKLDVFWAGATFFPKLQSRTKKVTTVYDLNHLIVPETMGTATLWAYRLFFRHDVRNADVVLAISEGTSKRLYDLTGQRASAIIRPAVSTIFTQQSDQAVQNCLDFRGIRKPYILAVATWEPRKNIELLVETFIKMKADGLLPAHELVLVGGKGWKDDCLRSLIETNLARDIIPLGYMPEQDLPLLYAGADIFLFPSVYEGFGIPVLEAIACGTRVVTTDIPELREAGGENAVYITPTSDGIRKGILHALSLSKANISHNLRFQSWHEGAVSLAEALSI